MMGQARAEHRLRLAQGSNGFISAMPRYVMEGFGMLFIAILAFALSRAPGGLATALPALGALAIGAQRLLPALQQGYSAWATIAGSHASLADTIRLLDQPLPAEALKPAPPPLPFPESPAGFPPAAGPGLSEKGAAGAAAAAGGIPPKPSVC